MTTTTYQDNVLPEVYGQWSLCKVSYYGDHVVYETLFEGIEDDCRDFALDNYTKDEQASMFLRDGEGREWDV